MTNSNAATLSCYCVNTHKDTKKRHGCYEDLMIYSSGTEFIHLLYLGESLLRDYRMQTTGVLQQDWTISLLTQVWHA